MGPNIALNRLRNVSWKGSCGQDLPKGIFSHRRGTPQPPGDRFFTIFEEKKVSENSFEEEERGQEQEEKEIEKHSPRRPLKKTSL